MRQIGAKVALSCATWRQDGPKMANLRAFLEASRQLFEILDAKPQIAKTLKNNRFFQYGLSTPLVSWVEVKIFLILAGQVLICGLYSQT